MLLLYNNCIMTIRYNLTQISMHFKDFALASNNLVRVLAHYVLSSRWYLNINYSQCQPCDQINQYNIANIHNPETHLYKSHEHQTTKKSISNRIRNLIMAVRINIKNLSIFFPTFVFPDSS